MTKKIVTILLMVSMMMWGAAFAGGRQKCEGTKVSASETSTVTETAGTDVRQHRPPHGHPGDLLGKYLHDNMMTEALSELSGQPAETVKAELEAQGVRKVFETYKIDHATFRTLMDGKTVKLAQQAANCGLITQDQATAIAQEIESAAAATTETTTTETTATETEPAN